MKRRAPNQPTGNAQSSLPGRHGDDQETSFVAAPEALLREVEVTKRPLNEDTSSPQRNPQAMKVHPSTSLPPLNLPERRS